MLQAGYNRIVVKITRQESEFSTEERVENFPCFGLVTSVGEHRGSSRRFFKYPEYNQRTYFGVFDKVRVGEKVLYDFTAHYSCPEIEGHIIIPMTLVVGVHRGVWRGINGWEIIHRTGKNEGVTPDGRKIGFRKAVRMQLDEYNILTKTKESLFKTNTGFEI